MFTTIQNTNTKTINFCHQIIIVPSLSLIPLLILISVEISVIPPALDQTLETSTNVDRITNI